MLNAEDWEADLRSGLNEVVDHAVRAGVSADQIFDALANALQAMRKDCDHESDPATNFGQLDEPANDWPAAIR